MTRQRKHARNSFGLLPQGYFERKPLNLEKSISSFLSVLLLIYDLNQPRPQPFYHIFTFKSADVDMFAPFSCFPTGPNPRWRSISVLLQINSISSISASGATININNIKDDRKTLD